MLHGDSHERRHSLWDLVCQQPAHCFIQNGRLIFFSRKSTGYLKLPFIGVFIYFPNYSEFGKEGGIKGVWRSQDLLPDSSAEQTSRIPPVKAVHNCYTRLSQKWLSLFFWWVKWVKRFIVIQILMKIDRQPANETANCADTRLEGKR